MLKEGLPLITENFRSLIDLPLPEKDMLKILKIATEFYEEYSGFGMLFSRQSGKQKIIEMELFFESKKLLRWNYSLIREFRLKKSGR